MDVSSREVGVFILSKSLSLVVVVVSIIIVERDTHTDEVGSNIAPLQKQNIKIKGNSGVIKDMQLMNGLKNRE